jgi:4-amino-4-deoxychorismate lyase
MATDSAPPAAAGVFETLAVVDGQPRLLERHLARLSHGCERLGMAAPPDSLLAAKIDAAAALPATGVIKLIVNRSAAQLHDAPRWSVQAEPPRLRPEAWAHDGVRIITCRTRWAIEPKLAGLKLLDRSAQTRARAEWTDAGIAEGLMLDCEGRLVSGTMTNVYAVIDGAVSTPAIVRCGVVGVMRAALLDAWHSAGQPALVRDMAPCELEGADEIFLSNALIGVWPVRTLDSRDFPVGPVARAASACIRRGFR